VMIGPGHVMVGGASSTTMTEKVHVDWLPAASVAVQVTRFAPSPNVDPVGGMHVTVGIGSQTSTTAGE